MLKFSEPQAQCFMINFCYAKAEQFLIALIFNGTLLVCWILIFAARLIITGNHFFLFQKVDCFKMETLKNRVNFVHNPISKIRAPLGQSPCPSMKHSVTCEFINPISNSASLRHSPSVDNLSASSKTPYDLLLEQIKKCSESETPVTHSERLAQHENYSSVGRYTLHEILGKGSFSKVQLATHQLTKGKLLLGLFQWNFMRQIK